MYMPEGSRRRATTALLAIVVLSLGFKLIGLNRPFLDAWWIRDLVVHSVAVNYYEKGINLLWPETDYTPDEPNYMDMELPLTPALAAAAWHLTGVNAWVPKLISILFSLASILLFHGTASRLLGRSGALAATALFALSPLNLFLSRKFMSEPLTLCLMLASIWAFFRWLETTRDGWLVLAAMVGALAALTKPPVVHFLLPLAWLLWHRKGWEGFRDARPYLFAAVVLVPLALWMRHSAAIGEQYWSVGTSFSSGAWFSRQWVTAQSLSLMVQRFTKEILTPLGMVGVLAGLPLVSRRSGQFLFTMWLLAALAYVLVLLGGNLRQTYYQLWLVAPAAGLAGCAWEKLVSSSGRGRRLWPWLVAGLLVWVTWGIHNYYDQEEAIPRARQALDQVDPQHFWVIVYPAGYNCLYYLDRQGWCGRDLDRDYNMAAVSSPEYVTERVARGAKYCVVFTAPNPIEFRDTKIEAYLARSYRRVARGEGFEVYRLAP